MAGERMPWLGWKWETPLNFALIYHYPLYKRYLDCIYGTQNKQLNRVIGLAKKESN